MKNKVPESIGHNIIIECHGSTPEELATIFQSFIKSIGVKKGNYTKVGGDPLDDFNGWIPPYSQAYECPINHETAKALIVLFRDVKKAYGKAYRLGREKGKEEGSNLLMSLHKGEITIQQLDKELKKST